MADASTPLLAAEDGHPATLDGAKDGALERSLLLKVDLRLCTIAGILCSLNLLDSGVISSASVTSMLSDLDLTGNRFSVSIFIFTIASVAFQCRQRLRSGRSARDGGFHSSPCPSASSHCAQPSYRPGRR